MKIPINASLPLGFRVLFILLMLYTILANAWVGDDIQIVFRQVWNFINGEGITFNYGQRVQAFTHPLWFFTMSLVSFFTGELFLTTIILCTVLSMLAIIVLVKLETAAFWDNLPILSPLYFLFFSWAFVDYATSGLENALSYFLTGILLFLLANKQSANNLKITYLILALLVLNRFDYGSLFLPLALVLIPATKSIRGLLRAVWPGLLVLTIWMTFATFYFGSPMPNTFYAKLYADYPNDEMYLRGWRYFLALRQDPVTMLILATGMVLSFASFNRILIALAIGQLAYFGYIFQIGGDFMQGRFFALPVYLSIGQIILAFAFRKDWSWKYSFKPGSLLLLTAIVMGLFKGFPFLYGVVDHNRKPVAGIYDEKGYYYEFFGLYASTRDSWPSIDSLGDAPPVEYRISNGFIGVQTLKNASYHLIDTGALADPFLSRIPAIRTEKWRIGHHYRKMPKEYGEYLVGNAEKISDRKLNGLLKDVDLATRRELFAPGRFASILRLNTDFYSSIDFSEYQDPESFVPSTDVVETVNIEDWNNALKQENLPSVYNFRFRRFNNNLNFVSDKSELVDGIKIGISPFTAYDIYVNGEKLHKINVKDERKINGPVNHNILKFKEPIPVRSITLKAVDANYELSPPFDYVSFLILFIENK